MTKKQEEAPAPRMQKLTDLPPARESGSAKLEAENKRLREALSKIVESYSGYSGPDPASIHDIATNALKE